MRNPLFDIDIKREGNKLVVNMDRLIEATTTEFHAKLEKICEADFDQFARKFGYVKLKPKLNVYNTETQVAISRDIAGFILSEMRGNACECEFCKTSRAALRKALED